MNSETVVNCIFKYFNSKVLVLDHFYLINNSEYVFYFDILFKLVLTDARTKKLGDKALKKYWFYNGKFYL